MCDYCQCLLLDYQYLMFYIENNEMHVYIIEMCESLPSNPLLSIDGVITNSCTSPYSMNWLSIHVLFHCSITFKST